MELRPLVGAFDGLVFALELDVLGGFVFLAELVVDVAIGDGCLSDLFVSDQNYLPGEVRHFVRQLICHLHNCLI